MLNESLYETARLCGLIVWFNCRDDPCQKERGSNKTSVHPFSFFSSFSLQYLSKSMSPKFPSRQGNGGTGTRQLDNYCLCSAIVWWRCAGGALGHGQDNMFWRHAAPDTGETVTQAEDLHALDTFICSTSFIYFIELKKYIRMLRC